MFSGQGPAMPQTKSIVGAIAIAGLVLIGSKTSPLIGYVFALSTLIMIVVAMYMASIWPTQSRKENSLVFSIFWGLIIGGIVPFLITTFLEGGVSAVYELFNSEP